uniref:Uncharacterized protein n=1 Tax=Arundo donax TaxID=35708 RepID=A0A0A9BWT9_ARUDO
MSPLLLSVFLNSGIVGTENP